MEKKVCTPVIVAVLDNCNTVMWTPGEEMPYAVDMLEEFLGKGVVRTPEEIPGPTEHTQLDLDKLDCCGGDCHG